MPEFFVNDLIEDNEGDKAVVLDVYEDGTLDIMWDCTGNVQARIPSRRFSNLSERVRELAGNDA